ncbi:barstar family protein [Variovorax sp. E3]|uniref:barstar family protein n=1 Tax=Variovorax sp. E3 TaxID=1914993 RepID=UPI0018DCE69D|nr:barstar family protein [Variovorax sp. E3]
MTARESEVTIGLRDVRSSLELQQRLMTSLDFPGWYGNNWNAFWDAITGLVDMPHRLRLVGWASLEDRLPLDAKQLQECLTQMQDEQPTLAAAVSYE